MGFGVVWLVSECHECHPSYPFVAFEACRREARVCQQEFEKVKKRRYELFMECFEHISAAIDQIYKKLCRNNSAQVIFVQLSFPTFVQDCECFKNRRVARHKKCKKIHGLGNKSWYTRVKIENDRVITELDP